jgi:hypothetical protein
MVAKNLYLDFKSLIYWAGRQFGPALVVASLPAILPKTARAVSPLTLG